MKLKPLADRLLILPTEQAAQTASGLVLPETAKEKPQQGKVIAVGKGRRGKKGKRVKMTVSKKDIVMYAKYAGTEVKIDGVKHLVMKESDILAIVGSKKKKKKKSKKAKAKKVAAAPAKPDDLKKIEGIGPKIAEILNSNGITTFKQLSKAKPAKIKAMLTEAGSRFGMANPETWPEQAAIAAKGDMAALKVLQDSLDGGKR